MLLHIFIIFIVAVLMIVGLLGSILPLVPGSPLILAGVFIYSWYTGFLIIGWKTLLVLGILTLLSESLDHLASVAGARKYGAGKWGMLGAFLGGIAGIFFGGIIGILVGPLLGAIFGELFHGAKLEASLRIGWGTFIGFLMGTLGKFIIALIMIGLFLLSLF
jgi:uncharacterized protein